MATAERDQSALHNTSLEREVKSLRESLQVATARAQEAEDHARDQDKERERLAKNLEHETATRRSIETQLSEERARHKSNMASAASSDRSSLLEEIDKVCFSPSSCSISRLFFLAAAICSHTFAFLFYVNSCGDKLMPSSRL